MTPRRASRVAVAAYAVCCLIYLWERAHNNEAYLLGEGVGLAALILMAIVLPVVVGYVIGRYWAPALVLLLYPCVVVVSQLEPFVPAEEGDLGWGLEVLLLLYCHVPLLLIAAAVKKLVRRRALGEPGWR